MIPWADAVIQQRLQPDGSLIPIPLENGWLASPYEKNQDWSIHRSQDIEPHERKHFSWFPDESSARAWQQRLQAEQLDSPTIKAYASVFELPEHNLMQIPAMRAPSQSVVNISAPSESNVYFNGVSHKHIHNLGDTHETIQGKEQIISLLDPPNGMYIVSANHIKRTDAGNTVHQPLRSGFIIVGDQPITQTIKLFSEDAPEPAFPGLTWTPEQRTEAETLITHMDQLISRLRQPLHQSSTQQFILEGAGDGDDAVVTITTDGKQLVNAHGFVPAWNQDTFDAGYGFHFRGGGGALWHQRHIFPILSNQFSQDYEQTSLQGTWQVRRNRWQQERLPAGNHHTLPGMPGPYSNYDYLEPEVHLNRHHLPLSITTERQSHRYWLDLRLTGLADGAAAHLRATWPAVDHEPQQLTVFNYNAASHSVDTSNLVINSSGVHGELRLRLNPDRWLPADRLRRTVSIPLDLNWDEETGPHTATIDMAIHVNHGATSNGKPVSGHITGSISSLWTGRYQCGPLQGRVFGGQKPIIDRNVEETSQPNDHPTSNPSLISLFTDRWLRLAWFHQRQQPLGHIMAPHFNDSTSALAWMRSCLQQATELASSLEIAADKNDVTNNVFLPKAQTVTTTAMTTSISVAQPPTVTEQTISHRETWLHPDEWLTFGPLPVVNDPQDPTVPLLPPFPLVPLLQSSPSSHAPQTGSPADVSLQGLDVNALAIKQAGMTLHRNGPSWGTVDTSNGLLLPHFFNHGMYIVKSRAMAWHATSTIVSEKEQPIHLRLSCADAGQLWMNGRLIFSSQPQDFRLHTTNTQEITVTAQAGTNHLVWYVRADYDRTWSRLQYRFGDNSDKGDEALIHFTTTDDPDIPEVPANLNTTVWRHSIAERTSRPVVHNDDIAIITEAGSLEIRDLKTGDISWQSRPLINHGDTSDALRIIQEKLQQRSAQPLAITDSTTQQLTYWAAHLNGGHAALFTASGDLKWETPLPLTDVTLTSHQNQLIAIGRPIPDNPKKFNKQHRGKFIYQAVALRMNDGQVTWDVTFPGNGRPSHTKRGGGGGPGIHQPWTQHVAILNQGEHAVAIIRGGVVLNLANGMIERPHLDPWIHGEAQWHHWGSWLFAASHGQLVAMQWGFDEAGLFQHQEVWRTHNELSSFGNTGSTVLCDGQYVYHQTPIPEHGPHCPGLWTQLHVHDLQTGNPVGELRPVLRDALQHRMPMLLGTDKGTQLHLLRTAAAVNMPEIIVDK